MEIIPTNPTKPVKPLNPKDPMENKPGENPGDINTLHQKADEIGGLLGFIGVGFPPSSGFTDIIGGCVIK